MPEVNKTTEDKQQDVQTAIQVFESKPPAIQQFELQQRAARLFAMSGLFADIKGQSAEQSIAQAFVKISLGESMGFNPAESMTGIDLIQGRVAISANMRASRMQRAGYDWDILQLDDKGCRLQLKYQGKPLMCEQIDTETGAVTRVPVVVSFTAADAATAGLIQKDNYKKNPRNMFFARAITNAQRWYAPGVLTLNILTVEEAETLSPPFANQEAPQDGSWTADETKRIDDLYAELGTQAATITSQKGKYLSNPQGLIEWLQGQVAKKHNDGSTRSRKKTSASEPKQESSRDADAKPEPAAPAATSEAQTTAQPDNPDAEPAGTLFTQQDAHPSPAAKSKPAPPPIDTEGWA